MKNFYPLKWLIVLTLVISGTAAAQDIHFSQFAETPLYRNPALAGIINGDIRVQAVYRTQWNSIAHAYKTTTLSAEYKMPVGKGDDFLTLGMLVMSDRAGTTNLTSTHVMPVLNFHKSLSNERNRYLSLGFTGGWVQRRLDASKITTNNQYNGMGNGEDFTSTQYSYLDAGAGISYNSGISDNPDDNLVLGIAYHHFNRPQNSFFDDASSVIPSKIVLSAGVTFGVTDYSTLLLQADHSQQGKYSETIGGIMYGLKLGSLPENPDYTVHGGVFLRLNDAVIPTIKMDYRALSFGLSYDVNISKLKTSSYGRGGFELSLAYIGFSGRNNSTLNAVRCPRF